MFNFSPIFLFLFFLTSCFTPSGSTDNASNSSSSESTHTQDSPNRKLKVRLKTVHGDIVFKFFPEKAPVTVDRISYLVNSGFYNGLTFHRVVPDFVIQTGDPSATGAGGSGKNIKAEFNDLKHDVGTVAMARKGNDIHSADSQFYISFGKFPHLDNKYTIFGKVIQGMDVAKKIVAQDKIINATLE